MFKLFKKNTTRQNRVSSSPKAYPTIVTEIHQAFETAGDVLLKESLEILSNCSTVNKEKGKRLISLGFTRAKQAKEVAEIEQKESEAKVMAELVSYYSRHYPCNKFITKNQVTTICAKYGLVFGEISRYEGFVPETKLDEIQNFKLNPKDDGILISEGVFLLNAEVRKDGSYYHIFKKGSATKYDNSAFQSNDGVRFYSNDRKDIFGLSHKGDMNFDCISGMQICAPIKDMDTKGMRVDNYRLVRHVPDPVVLQPVKGGYLIVCAWGDEASDELVVNPKHN